MIRLGESKKKYYHILCVYAQEQYRNIGDRIWRSVEMEVMFTAMLGYF